MQNTWKSHRFFLHLVILGLCLCYVYQLPAQSNEQTSHKEITILADTYLSALTELKQFNGVVLLQKQGEIVLNKAYNITTDKNSSLYVHESSQFDIRSIAKLFAKHAMYELEREEKIDLDSNISYYIPAIPMEKQISFNHLLNHTSGLPREFINTAKPPVNMTTNDVIKYIANQNLEFAPGTDTRYSNLGYQLIYYSLGQIYNSTYVDVMRTKYFNTMGMVNSGSNFNDPLSSKLNYAFGHVVKDSIISCICDFENDDMKMGNLFSTAQDLNMFLNTLDENTNAALVDSGSISHAGGSKGKRAYIERNFIKNYQIIFLANYDAIPFQKLTRDLKSLMEGLPTKIPKPVNRKAVNIDPYILKQYEGTYDIVDAGHILVTIKEIDGQLFLFQNGKNNGQLFAETDTIFFSDSNSEESVKFILDNTNTWQMLIDFQGVQWRATRQ